MDNLDSLLEDLRKTGDEFAKKQDDQPSRSYPVVDDNYLLTDDYYTNEEDRSNPIYPADYKTGVNQEDFPDDVPTSIKAIHSQLDALMIAINNEKKVRKLKAHDREQQATGMDGEGSRGSSVLSSSARSSTTPVATRNTAPGLENLKYNLDPSYQPTYSVCVACQKPIHDEVVTGCGQNWHPEHFRCARCQAVLTRRTFYEVDERPYCEDCNRHLFSPRCFACNEPIDSEFVVALDRTWHREHLRCTGCKNVLDYGLHEHGDRPYCADCYASLFGLHCSGCGGTIEDTYLNALDRPWHRHCFVCHECKRQLSSGTYFESNGKPVCAEHVNGRKICHQCRKPLQDRFVTLFGRHYHPDCFTCAFCLTPLPNGIFKERSGKQYCSACYGKLFA